MPDIAVEFAVFGASPLACLVAGLLAERHGKTVVQIAEPEARYRLTRSIDLSIAPITRPETWTLLGKLVPETQKLLTRIAGRRVLRRLDPLLYAHHAEGQEALGHIAHMARANGLMADRVANSKLGPNRSAFRFGDVLTIDRQTLLPRSEKWLTGLGVRRLRPDFATLHADGVTELADGENTIRAARSILIDEAAIMRHVPTAQWPDVLQTRPHASILISAKHRLSSDVMLNLDTGLTLIQLDGGSVAATGPGTLSQFSARLAQTLLDRGVTQQIGQSGFDALVSLDGTPIIDALDTGLVILAGLGTTGAFLAPLFARYLTNSASDEEAVWSAARSSSIDRRAVAEFLFRLPDHAA
ncbi:hypothetical protein ASG47_05565 [Devosia sp. Leaf420]|uniref:hypothetical protein n=1 Tax=Devosia sp. Leaf420 TaxID=1736374 RepID=UPI000712E15F|nr:hypothetical protein [Devosia sp. Leaf420]KQT49778.1 hypothetical protein ASG47_05565 [Devosia sp. Leaf420]